MPLTLISQVWSLDYLDLNQTFQSRVYSSLVSRSIPAIDFMPSGTDRIAGWLSDASCRPRDILNLTISALQWLSDMADRRGNGGNYWSGRSSYHAAISQCLRLGAAYSETDIVRLLYSSALSNYTLAILQAPLIEESCVATYEYGNLSRFCLVIGAFLGIHQSATLLRTKSLDLYEAVKWTTSHCGRTAGRLDSTSPLLCLMQLRDLSSTPPQDVSVLEALQSSNAELARALMQRDVLGASMVDERGAGVLHYLTFLEDDDAASLASLSHSLGAALTEQASFHSHGAFCIDGYGMPEVTSPLSWALIRNMPKYFTELLRLHMKTETPVHDYSYLVVMSATFHSHKMLSPLCREAKETPELFDRYDTLGLSEVVMELAMAMASKYMGIATITRRIRNGKNAQNAPEDTIRILLEQGVKPFDSDFPIPSISGNSITTFVTACIKSTDLTTFECIVKAFAVVHPSDDEIFEKLARPLRLCILYSSYECFKIIVSTFPELARKSFRQVGLEESSESVTPLNLAAMNPDPRFAKALLELGADMETEYDQFTPLARALATGQVETAEAIYQYMTEVQRRRTFGVHKARGFTMTGRLISAWLGTRDKRLLDVFDWMAEKDGLMFEGNAVNHGEAAWALLLVRKPPPVVEYVDLDARMAKKLFVAFQDRIGEPDVGGMCPIHRACINGHLQMLKDLVELGADVNAELLEPKLPGYPSLIGQTALDLALTRSDPNLPREIRIGGKVEIARWRRVFKEMAMFLLAHGAKNGSCSHESTQTRARFYHIPQVSLLADEEYSSKREEEPDVMGNWPERIGPDRTSPDLKSETYSKLWILTRGADGNVRRLSRLLVNRNLILNQPEAGLRNAAPNSYQTFLKRTAALRTKLWQETGLPSNAIGCTLDSYSREWHEYGAALHDEDPRIEPLPRYRKIFYIGSPPSESPMSADFFHILGHLHETCLPENPLEAPFKIISIFEEKKHGAQEVGKFLDRAITEAMTPGRGLQLYTMLWRQEQTELTAEQKGLLDRYIGGTQDPILLE